MDATSCGRTRLKKLMGHHPGPKHIRIGGPSATSKSVLNVWMLGATLLPRPLDVVQVGLTNQKFTELTVTKEEETTREEGCGFEG